MVTGDIESYPGAPSTLGSLSGSHESNQRESRLTDYLLASYAREPGISKIRSPPKYYTREASQTEHVMCPSQVPTAVKIGDDFKISEKQKIEDLRNSEIIVTNSIESQTSINSNSSHKRRIPADAPEDDVVDMNIKKSRLSNDLNLEESLGKVRQDTEDIINAGPQELRMVESSEGSNFSDCIPSPTHTVKTEYQTANNSETDYQPIDGNEDYETNSLLSILESQKFACDPKNTANYFQWIHQTIGTDKQQQQQQQQQQKLLSSQLYPDSILISSIGNTPEEQPRPCSILFPSNTKSSFIPIDPSLMHISEREDSITLDGTLFLKRFYSNIRNCNHMYLSVIGNHNGIRKFSSTSSVFIDSNTVTQPNMKHTLKSVALAVHNLLIFDSKNQQPRNDDVFDEGLHPISSHDAICSDSCLIPEAKTIYKFTKHLFHSAQLTAECVIISLIYLERLLISAEIDISVCNWKRILFGSILLASKVWNDQAVWNVDYCNIMQQLQIDDLNQLERSFLKLLQFEINVPSSVFAKYYFDLRTFAVFNNISLPLEPLNKQKAAQLEAMPTHCDPDINISPLIMRSNSVEQIFPQTPFVLN
ncbi:Cyclin-Y-like protein 1 [Oopsacas minuta]|uniref:Cyclin-Y-like protein 1 n=1 Tax=Oopsacas minuta TaxID=111878 RepID=A0AAV7JS65_9METZ|nr:Cyclin-Y-like protein 1 [Oopsacas minuta]